MFRRTRGHTKPACVWSVHFAISHHPAPINQLVEPPQPDIAHRDFARLALDLKADESRLVLRGSHASDASCELSLRGVSISSVPIRANGDAPGRRIIISNSERLHGGDREIP